MKVAVVQAAAANQLPHSFDRIEIGAVRWQEVQPEMVAYFVSPGLVKTGVMVPSVVGDDDGLAPGPTSHGFEFAQKPPTSLGIEHALRLRHHQFPVGQSNGAEVADTLASGCMITDRIFELWRDPHATARTVLLEMHFVDRPQINFTASRQGAEFFYAWLATEGRLAPPEGEVYEAENPSGETAVGIAGLSSLLPIPGVEILTGTGHPTFGLGDQTYRDYPVRQPLPESVGIGSSDWVVPGARLRTDRPIHGPRIAAPSLPPCVASRPIALPPGDSSNRGRRVKPRAVDDRIGRYHCDESHPVWPESCFRYQK